MAKKVQSAITLYDITDGTSPNVLTNTNIDHSIAASADGTVAAAEFATFSTDLQVWNGTTLLVPSTAQSDSAQANNSWRISADSGNTSGIAVTGTGWPAASGFTVTTDTSGRKITVSAPTTGLNASSADSGHITFSVRVKNSQGTINTLQAVSYLNKSITGAGANFIYLNSNANSFTADHDGTLKSSQSDIIVDISTAGSPGALEYYVSTNGTSYTQVSSTSTGVGGIKAYDTDTSGSVASTGVISTVAKRLAIASSNLSGSSDKFRLRVAGANGGQDEIQIYKLRDGTPPEFAIKVIISSSDDRYFSADKTAAKTLTARVYDLQSGAQITTGLTYAWYTDDSEGTRVKVNNTTANLVQSTGVNATANRIVVGPEDVTGSQQYVCVVTVA